MADSFYIRSAEITDAAALLEIYRPYVEETSYSFECKAPDLEEFTRRMVEIRANYPYLVLEGERQILGYAYAARFRTRSAYDWAVESSIYLRKDCHRRGLGRQLYGELERRLKVQGVTNMNACIAWPHPESVSFHCAMGFRMIGRFEKCAYKLGAWQDMVWMEKHIADHPHTPGPLLPPEK